MIWLLLCLALSAAAMIAFIVLDAIAAFDGNPYTHTLSEKLKMWRRRHAGRTFLMGLVIFQILVIPFYLFMHLILEVW